MTIATRSARRLSPTARDLAVAYFRVSSAEQAGEGHQSLDYQRERAYQEAEKRGKAIVREFVDVHSATKGSRREYQAMLEYLRGGNAATVFVLVLDRFGRNQREILTATWEFNDLGVEIVAIDREYDSRNIVDTSIYPMLAQMESERISQRVRGTISRAVKTTNAKVGVAPYGYRRHVVEGGDVVWEQDPMHAAIVRRMYKLRVVDAKGFKGIADTLNGDGIPSPRGSQWQAQTVQRILGNPALRGAKDYATGRNWREIKDGVEPSVTEGYYDPPILTLEEWERLDSFDKLARGKRGKGNVSGYLLSGILRCAYCGGPMVGNTDQHSGKRRYGCSRYRQSTARCAYFNSHDAVEVEKAVLEWIARHTDKAAVRAGMAMDADANAAVRDERKASIEADITRLDSDFTMAMDMLRRGILNEDAFRRDHEPREQRRAILTEELGQISLEATRAVATEAFAEQVPSLAKEVRQLVGQGHTGAAKAILRRLIGSATVDRDNNVTIALAGRDTP